MGQYRYTTKICKDEFGSSNSNFSFNLQKPHFCPICRAPQEGSRSDSKLFPSGDKRYYGVVEYICNSCGKKYLVTYDIDTGKEAATFGAFYPVFTATYENDLLSEFSPRFIEFYNQALRSELAGDIDLAATGYRHALECLVKDYAINRLQKEHDEVCKKNLCQAIGEYLDSDMVKTADVVRILGNDYTHYERRYPQVDFEVLKRYLDIFTQLIETKELIAHPPVSR
nr:MAG TPA: protein of unknown function (DUF4145) [Caudoviricetes sp.]